MSYSVPPDLLEKLPLDADLDFSIPKLGNSATTEANEASQRFSDEVASAPRVNNPDAVAKRAAQRLSEESSVEYMTPTGGGPPQGRGGSRLPGGPPRDMPPPYLPQRPGSTPELGRTPMPAIPRPFKGDHKPIDGVKPRTFTGGGPGDDDFDRAQGRLVDLMGDLSSKRHTITGPSGAFEGLKESVRSDPPGWARHIIGKLEYRDSLPATQTDQKAKLERDLSMIYMAMASDVHSEGNQDSAVRYLRISYEYYRDSKALSKSGSEDADQIARIMRSLSRQIEGPGDK